MKKLTTIPSINKDDNNYQICPPPMINIIIANE